MVSGHTGLAWPGLASLASFMSINGYINTAPEYIGSSFHPFFLNHGVQVKCGISHISNKILKMRRTDLTPTIGHPYFKPVSLSVLLGRVTVHCRGSTHGGLFCMKVPYYKGQKLTRRFSQKNSGSLIIHENVSKNEEKKLPKKIENFFGQTVFGFWKTMIRATYAEKMKKIVRAVLEISSLLGIGHARAGRHAWPKIFRKVLFLDQSH